MSAKGARARKLFPFAERVLEHHLRPSQTKQGAWTRRSASRETDSAHAYCTASRNYATWYCRNFYSVFVVQRICMEVQRSYCVHGIVCPTVRSNLFVVLCRCKKILRMKRAGRDARHKLEISWARSPLESYVRANNTSRWK